VTNAVNGLTNAIATLKTSIDALTGTAKSGFKVTATCNCNCANCDKNCANNSSGSGSSGGGSGANGGTSGGSGSNAGGSGNGSNGATNSDKEVNGGASNQTPQISSLQNLLKGDLSDRGVYWSSSDQSIGKSFYSYPGMNLPEAAVKDYVKSADNDTFTSNTVQIGLTNSEYDELKKQHLGAYNALKQMGMPIKSSTFTFRNGGVYFELDPSSSLASILKSAYTSRLKAKGYEMGGMPNSGELFVARENGTPEMVGSIGGHTAVANANTQIVSAVAAGVSQSNEAVVTAINNASSNVVTAIDNKDTSVKIGDREIAAANNRGQRQLGRNLMS
jgi:hypothetical protein